MLAALTGMTGFIGQAATGALRSSGHGVRGLVRPGREGVAETLGASFVTGSMNDRAAFDELLEGARVLVHNAVDWDAVKGDDLKGHLDVNLCAGIELLDAAARRGCVIVLISSVAVHHHMLDRWGGEVDHMHPSRPGSRYGALKVALEAHCWSLHAEHGIPVCMLRPAAVYGIDPRNDRSIGWPMIESLVKGESWQRRGGGKFVHVQDVAACIAAAADIKGVRIHHLADCYARWSDWVAMGAEALGLDLQIDHQAPPAPANMFKVDDVQRDLGVSLGRGHAGIAGHIRDMIELQCGEP